MLSLEKNSLRKNKKTRKKGEKELEKPQRNNHNRLRGKKNAEKRGGQRTW